MKKMASWLITIFIVMFWTFRLIVTFMDSMGLETVFKPMDMTTEMIVLFVSFVSILFIVKRSLFGGILYAVSYGYYFGINAYNGAMRMVNNPSSMQGAMDVFVSLVAMILVISVVLDLALNKDRHESKDDKNTHWFYKNEKYDRVLDERADKNQYRT